VAILIKEIMMFTFRRFCALTGCGLVAVSGAAPSIASELEPGTVIEKANLDQVKSNTFEGHTIASLLTEKIEWQIRNWNLKIPLGHAKPSELDPRYIEATKKYASRVKFDPQTREVTGWVAGLPFPEVSESDPYAGDKLIWNFYYASPEGDTTENRNAFVQIKGDKGIESTQEWLFLRYYYKGRLGGDKPVVGDGSLLTKTLFVATAPQDVKGVGTFTVRYDEPRLEDSWAYIKSARRTRRLSGGAWMDPVGGLDLLNDDIYIWNARPSFYPKIRVIGKRWILAITDAKLNHNAAKAGTPEEWPIADLKNPPYWNPVQAWQPREVWVIEATPPAEHPYSKKIVYMDVNYPKMYLGEGYDKKGEFWKMMIYGTTPTVGQDGIKYISSVQGVEIDFKAVHATAWLMRGYKLNDKNVKPDDVSISALESIAR